MSDQLSPKITVIIAVYNGAKTLQQCIDSVAQQTYANKQLIIIDGGSADGTVELLKRNDSHISYWVSESDNGIYNAWNKGLKQAKSDWICFLGADDFFWDDQVLERVSMQLERLPVDVRVAYGQIMLLTADGVNIHATGEPWAKVKKHFKHKMSIPHPGVMHHRSLFELHGKFDESFRIVGDYELLLRELKTGDAVFLPDIIVTGMRQGGISSNPEQSLTILREVRRAQVMHGQSVPSRVWLMAVVRVYIRLLLWGVLGEKRTRKALDFGRRIIGLPAYWTKI
ncbi:MAG: glycosyltransferase family 2 protein [Methylotenera sp.]|uniref:glycosyltransferase family 2 protein n=1 Tax=Methylotenera sp. TaxID=2051956 RepID=UPI00271A0DAA|nr:glycosyltransferase family 2 protein [Methylotenera sp.]MDO9206070.1 glycosyltransferase family 2 protein [Methylotenera sp.]MDP2402213.1 glycosyltransferase family 2 protein [Methylotenera sp.]MDP3094282.1 glycosyltransferase family 2 protein [Methylotenera sp.]MDZ4223973.1 glycosyltransferase family 2 protein [Methylotenera sp.]